jgi:hypothetical protein
MSELGGSAVRRVANLHYSIIPGEMQRGEWCAGERAGCISHFAENLKSGMVCYQELGCSGGDLFEDG